MCGSLHIFFFFFFNDTATTEIYTLSLHDALPILLVGFVVFTGFMFWLTGRSIVSKAIPVDVVFKNVSGLKEGDPVRVSGVKKGRVGEVRLQRGGHRAGDL